jgi:hypothetical protein
MMSIVVVVAVASCEARELKRTRRVGYAAQAL